MDLKAASQQGRRQSSASPARRGPGGRDTRSNSPAHNNTVVKRGDVSTFAYQLISFEMVAYFDEKEEYGKLETLGFNIGHRFVERFVRNHSKFANTLEIVKFLCKDLWGAMFGKHVDKLQTNHKGVFVLHDNQFSWVSNVEVDYRSQESLDEAKKFLIVPCGLIRGALSNLGVRCTVRAEFSTLPACFFNIQIHQELLKK